MSIWNGNPAPGVGTTTTFNNYISPEPGAQWFNYVDWIVSNYSAGSSSSLAGLTDVNLSSPTNGQTLAYNGVASKWENTSPSLAGLSDVDPTGWVDLQVLQYNSLDGKWESVTLPSANTFAGLSDVSITSQQDQQLVRYDSATSKYINAQQIVFLDRTAVDDDGTVFKMRSITYPTLQIQYNLDPLLTGTTLPALFTIVIPPSIPASLSITLATATCGMSFANKTIDGSINTLTNLPNSFQATTGLTGGSPTVLSVGYNEAENQGGIDAYRLPTGAKGDVIVITNNVSPATTIEIRDPASTVIIPTLASGSSAWFWCISAGNWLRVVL